MGVDGVIPEWSPIPPSPLLLNANLTLNSFTLQPLVMTQPNTKGEPMNEPNNTALTILAADHLALRVAKFLDEVKNLKGHESVQALASAHEAYSEVRKAAGSTPPVVRINARESVLLSMLKPRKRDEPAPVTERSVFDRRELGPAIPASKTLPIENGTN